jgi:hypothetical protein
MGKKGRVVRLVPAGKQQLKPGQIPVTSLKHARKLTGAFHTLLQEQARGVDVSSRMEAMGGRDAYQAASVLSQASAMKSARYLFKTLTRWSLQPAKGAAPLRLLEIGAINTQISAVPWLQVRAVDLLSTHPAIEQRDAFKVPIGSGPAGAGAAAKDAIMAPAPCRLAAVDWAAVRAATLAGAEPEAAPAVRAGKRKRSAEGEEGGGGAPGGSTTVTAAFARHGPSIITCAQGSAATTAAPQPPAGPAVVYSCLSRRAAGPPPVCGGYDIVVCAMVINCVVDPAARTELLVRCRDHLAPGGLFYLSLPSRCLDVSSHITRAAFEALLTCVGFTLRDAKTTPKISMYVLQRVDVVMHRQDLQPPPEGRGVAPTLEGAGGGPPPSAPAEPLSILSAATYGEAWVPRIVPACAREEGLLGTRLATFRPLLQAEQPVTGFTRTEFGLAIPAAWVARAKA